MKRLEPIIVGVGFVGFLYAVNHVLGHFLNKNNTNDDKNADDIVDIMFEPIDEICEQAENEDNEYTQITNEDPCCENENNEDDKREILRELLEKKEYLIELQEQLVSIQNALDQISKTLN